MLTLQNSKSVYVLSPTTAVSTSRSASFDFLGADHATIRVLCSASVGTNSAALQALSLLHSDNTNSSTFATMVADLGTQVTSSHEIVYHVDLKTAKRYGKVILTPHTADTIATAVHVTLSRLENSPTSTTGMVNTTNDAVSIVIP